MNKYPKFYIFKNDTMPHCKRYLMQTSKDKLFYFSTSFDNPIPLNPFVVGWESYKEIPEQEVALFKS